MHLTDNFRPVVGGLERAVEALANYWQSEGHTVSIVTAHRDDSKPIEKIGENITIYRLPLGLARLKNAYESEDKIFFPPSMDLEFSYNFKKLIRKLPRIDIAHAHGWIVYSSINELYKNKIPVVLGAHDQGQVCAKKTLLDYDDNICEGPSYIKCLKCSHKNYGLKGYPIVTCLFLSARKHDKLDSNIAISSQVAELGGSALKKYRKPMQIIPTFIDSNLLTKAEKAKVPDWAPKDPYILFAGALSKHKGVDVLIAAHEKMIKNGYRHKLVLAGIPKTGSMYNTNENLIIVTNKPHDEILGATKNAEVAVVPSINPEAFGQSAVEALACGTALVASKAGGLLDVTANGKYAELVEVNDPVKLYDSIVKILEDAEYRKKLENLGKKRAKELTLEVVGPQLEKHYRDIIERKIIKNV